MDFEQQFLSLLGIVEGLQRRVFQLEEENKILTRGQVRDSLSEMHELYRRRYTPKVKPSKACNACSLKDICLPKLMGRKKVASYLAAAMEGLE